MARAAQTRRARRRRARRGRRAAAARAHVGPRARARSLTAVASALLFRRRARRRWRSGRSPSTLSRAVAGGAASAVAAARRGRSSTPPRGARWFFAGGLAIGLCPGDAMTAPLPRRTAAELPIRTARLRADVGQHLPAHARRPGLVELRDDARQRHRLLPWSRRCASCPAGVAAPRSRRRSRARARYFNAHPYLAARRGRRARARGARRRCRRRGSSASARRSAVRSGASATAWCGRAGCRSRSLVALLAFGARVPAAAVRRALSRAVQRRPLGAAHLGAAHRVDARAARGRRARPTRCCGSGPAYIARAAAALCAARAAARACAHRRHRPALLLDGRARPSRGPRRSRRSVRVARPRRGLARRARARRALRPLLGGSLMVERTVKIVNKNGLHARPAAEIVKVAAKFQSEITIVRDDLEVNGKSIMGVMMLAAECGASLLVRADGADAEQARRRDRGADRRQVRGALVERRPHRDLRVARHRRRARCTCCAGRCRRCRTASIPDDEVADGDRRASTPRSTARASGCAACATRVEQHAGPRGGGDLRRRRSPSSRTPTCCTGVEELIRQNLAAEKAFDVVMLEWRQHFARHAARDDARARRRPHRCAHPRALAPARPSRPRSRWSCRRARTRSSSRTTSRRASPCSSIARPSPRIATDAGTRTSHVAILARSLGLPAVVGLRDATARLTSGERVILDGTHGHARHRPDRRARSPRTTSAQRERGRGANGARRSRRRRGGHRRRRAHHAARERRPARGGRRGARAAAPRAWG